MAKQKDPNLKVTMKSIEDSEGDKSEEKETTATDGEENTADDPESEEGDTDSAEPEEGDEEGEKTEGDAEKDDEDKPAERLEFYTEDEESPAPEPKDDRAFAKMRKALREKDLELAELRKLKAQSEPTGAPDPGPEPDETDEDVNFDQAKLKKKTIEWHEKVNARKNWEAEQTKKAEAAQQEAREIIGKYHAAKTVFSKLVPGYDDAEKTFNDLFDAPRQDILFRNCSNPPKVIYLLHTRYPDLMERLSKSNNRDEIVRELAKLEVMVKERKVGTPPKPPKRIGGSGSTVQGEDPRLVAARKRAEKSDDYTEVGRIQRELQEKERANKARK